MLSNGDEASFIISADEFFLKTLQTDMPKFLPLGSYFKIRIHIIDLQTEREYEKEKLAFLNWIDDFGEYEREMLKQFIQEEKLEVSPSYNFV